MKETTMPSVHELIERRRRVAAQIQALQVELQRLDEAVYSAFESVVAMLAPPSERQRPVKVSPPPHVTESQRSVNVPPPPSPSPVTESEWKTFVGGPLRMAGEEQATKEETPRRAWELLRGLKKGATVEEVEAVFGDRRKFVPGVVHVLKGLNRPVKTRELMAHLAALGYEVGGKNPVNNLAAHLSSMDIVESTPEGWVLKQRGS
ncbi:hypothetical protein LGN19_22980 [Burkholderia sp. AU30198]|uniref:hypothetical protein n=1 Tax=Burkholderia sp. AU30198 TaxID=2879627 RepID=UPI001CF1CD00|nr:hypothetical protein [Burkholderia sp. AU30198]MCA8296664.1 hypothetical protein [Burkholderia sp. AU30198]